MCAFVERRELQPCLEVNERRVTGRDAREMLQHREAVTAKSTPLGGEPGLEQRAAADLQAVEKRAGEQLVQPRETLHRQLLNARRDCAEDLDSVHAAAGQVEVDRVAVGLDPATAEVVDQAPDLAQTPAKFAPRILGHVPKQIAQPAARDRVRRERQIGEQRTDLA
jgi:hypothetical protein